MKSFTPAFSRTFLMLMSLLALSLSLNQSAQAAPTACTYSIFGDDSITVDNYSISFSKKVLTSAPNCNWTAKSNNVWITVTSGTNYSGEGRVEFRVDALEQGTERIGTLTIAGLTFTVKQTASCRQIIPSTRQFMSKEGGEFSLNIANQITGCLWRVMPVFTWIQIKGVSSPAAYTTSQNLTFIVSPNYGKARTNWIQIGNYEFTVYQQGTCDYAVSPTSQTVPSAGGNYTVHSLSHPACNLNLPNSSDSAWVKINNTSGALTDIVVSYTVAPNNGAARTAKLTIGDKQVTISQAAAQPAPTLAGLTPGFVVAGSPSLTVTLIGTNFTANSEVRLSGVARPTVFVSSTQLRLTFTDADLKNATRYNFTVFDSGAGRSSNEQPFLVLSPQASVSAASFKGENIAPDSIVAAFGVKLADSTAVAKTIPLPTNLAGTMVRVIDSKNIERLAPLFFVSANQVNYLVPPETALGQASVIIISGSVNISLGYMNVTKVAPGIFTAASTGAGQPSALVLRVKANGQQVYEPLVGFDQASQKFVGLPIELGVQGEQVFLVLYGTGIRNNNGLNTINLAIGGTPVTAAYAGPSGLTGLDQINASLPASLKGRGEVDLVMSVDEKPANTVKLIFK